MGAAFLSDGDHEPSPSASISFFTASIDDFSILSDIASFCSSVSSLRPTFGTVGGNISSYLVLRSSLCFRLSSSRLRILRRSSSGFSRVRSSTGFTNALRSATACSSALISLSSNSSLFRPAVFAVVNADFSCPSFDSAETGKSFLSLLNSAISSRSMLSGVACSLPVAFGSKFISCRRFATSSGLTPCSSHSLLFSIALSVSSIFSDCLAFPRTDRIFAATSSLLSGRHTP